MFATLAGGYPRPDLGPDATDDDLVRAALADQEAAGLEILSDGHVRRDDGVRSFVERLEGFEVDGDAPVARREPRWNGPILVDAWPDGADYVDAVCASEALRCGPTPTRLSAS